MIKKKTVVILLAAVLALCAAVAALYMWDGVSKDDASGSEESQSIYIYEGDEESVSSIKVKIPGDSYELVKGEDGKWKIKGLEDAAVKNYAISSLATSMAKLAAKSVVEEGASDFAKYGLENSEYEITAVIGDDNVTYIGGSITPLNDGYYLKRADSDTVYTVYQSTFTTLFAKKENYRDITFLTVKTDSINAISIKKADLEISLRKMSEPFSMGGYNIATWEMISPSYNTIDDSRLSTLILEKLTSIGVESIVSDKGDFANYGLDNPYAVVTITDTDGTTQKINVGGKNTDSYYACIDGDRTIYSIAADSLSFIDVDAFSLVNKFANIANIDYVQKIVVNTAGGESCTLSIEGEEDNKIYKLNGTEVEEDKFKKDLYQSVIGLICDGFCTDAKYSAPEFTIEFYINDGSYDKLEFVDYNDRNYAVFKNGKCTMHILKKDVKTAVDKVMNYN